MAAAVARRRGRQLCRRCRDPTSGDNLGDLSGLLGRVDGDHRPAILDCLNELVAGGGSTEGPCGQCGGSLPASDSESLTTVYSSLSGARAASNDSDEGTMADNSDESADEGKKPGSSPHDDSSGYDEPGVLGNTSQHGEKKKYDGKEEKLKEEKTAHKERITTKNKEIYKLDYV